MKVIPILVGVVAALIVLGWLGRQIKPASFNPSLHPTKTIGTIGLPKGLPAPVFKVGRLEQTIRVLPIVSGVVSIAGLIGVPLSNMQVRDIGIIGYAGVAPVAFLLIGIVFGRTQPALVDTERSRNSQLNAARI